MAEKVQKIPVNKDLRPSYYDAFHCIMGACRQNCCDNPWRIEFDKRDYLTVKRAPKSPEMEELTRQCMHRLRERSLDHMYAERFAGREYFMENLMVASLFYLQMPYMESGEALWKGYMDFCKLYAFYRFLAVMSCREGTPGDREGLFEMIVFASRALVHDHRQRERLKENLFQNDSATLAHMAILLCG